MAAQVQGLQRPCQSFLKAREAGNSAQGKRPSFGSCHLANPRDTGQGDIKWQEGVGREFPGGPVVRTLHFHCQGAWVRSVVRTLRSCKPRGQKKKRRGGEGHRSLQGDWDRTFLSCPLSHRERADVKERGWMSCYPHPSPSPAA